MKGGRLDLDNSLIEKEMLSLNGPIKTQTNVDDDQKYLALTHVNASQGQDDRKEKAERNSPQSEDTEMVLNSASFNNSDVMQKTANQPTNSFSLKQTQQNIFSFSMFTPSTSSSQN